MRAQTASFFAGAMLSLGIAGAASANPPVSVDAPICTLTVGSNCLFDGNITPTSLGDVDAAYNAQPPSSGSLDLAGFADVVEYDPATGNEFSGTITSSFLVSYYAVKAGNQFQLYEITPSLTFSWNTNDLLVGRGNHPALSHIIYVGNDATVIPTVPEPATWAMMLVGFGGLGAVLRRRRGVALTA